MHISMRVATKKADNWRTRFCSHIQATAGNMEVRMFLIVA